jgi:hypothetical protein
VIKTTLWVGASTTPHAQPPVMNIFHDIDDINSLDCLMMDAYIINQAVG